MTTETVFRRCQMSAGGVAGPSCPQLESTALLCSGLSPSLQEGCHSPQKPSWSPDPFLVTGNARPSHCCPLRKFIDLPILCLVMKFIDPEGQWQFINRADPGFRGQVEERLGVGRGHASLQGALVSEQKDRLGTGCTQSPGVSGRQTPGARTVRLSAALLGSVKDCFLLVSPSRPDS